MNEEMYEALAELAADVENKERPEMLEALPQPYADWAGIGRSAALADLEREEKHEKKDGSRVFCSWQNRLEVDYWIRCDPGLDRTLDDMDMKTRWAALDQVWRAYVATVLESRKGATS